VGVFGESMKKPLSCVLALLWIFVFCQALYGKEYGKEKTAKEKEMTYAPKYITFGSANSNGILKMDCEGENNFAQLNCDFTQIFILKNTEEELAKKRKEFREQTVQIQKEDFNKLRRP
jgi:hypothetical protein